MPQNKPLGCRNLLGRWAKVFLKLSLVAVIWVALVGSSHENVNEIASDKDTAADFSLDVVKLNTLSAFSAGKLSEEQTEQILKVIEQFEAEVHQATERLDQTEQIIKQGKKNLVPEAQKEVEHNAFVLKRQVFLAKEQAEDYAAAILHDSIQGKNIEQTEFLRHLPESTFDTALKIEQIINDPNQQTWSAQIFRTARNAAEEVKNKFSKQEIKEFLEAYLSDEHPNIKKFSQVVLGERTTEYLSHPSSKEIKAAMGRYFSRLKDDILFTNRQFASLNEISAQLANDEKIITDQAAQESRWSTWLGRDGVAAQKAREAIAYLAALTAELDEQTPHAKAALAALSRNAQDWYQTFANLNQEQWKQLAKEEKDALLASWQSLRNHIYQGRKALADHYADAIVGLRDYLMAHQDDLQEALANAMPEWMKQDFARLRSLGWDGPIKQMMEKFLRPNGDLAGKSSLEAQQILREQLAFSELMMNPSPGNGDNEILLMALLSEQAGRKFLLAQQKAVQEACWERWLRLAIPGIKTFIPQEVQAAARGMDCPIKMRDLGAAFKQLQKDADAFSILFNTLGINCQAADREERYCRVHQAVQNQIAKKQAADQGFLQRWASKIKSLVSSSEEQELLRALETGFQQQCGGAGQKICAKSPATWNVPTSDGAQVNDDRFGHPKSNIDQSTDNANWVIGK